MKIINLQAENVKRLVAIDITPDSNVVKITGKNGNGKTSVLDAIWWCLGGAKNIQARPIHDGAEEGFVTLNLGEIKVTRTFRYKGNGEVTTSLKVEGSKGSPQSIIDKILGDLTFDPLNFARMEAKKQFDTLKQFVPDVDFEAIESDNKSDRETRTIVGRDLKQAKASVIGKTVNENQKFKRIDIDENEISKKLKEAEEHNSDIEKRKTNRENMQRRIIELRNEAAQKIKQADDMADKLKNAGNLAEKIDIELLSNETSEARKTNKICDDIDEKKILIKMSETLQKEYDTLTKQIEIRNTKKTKAISSAKLPVEGITFGDGEIILNNQPFNQASDAEQLLASVLIAMALNPKLKVIRVRDGSLLDENSMAILEKIAAEKDFQIWIEIVDNSGKVGFVIEEGRNKEKEIDF